MGRRGRTLVAATIAGLMALAPVAAGADGHATTIASFESTVAPEGIAVAPDGTVYVSTAGGGQIWRLDDEGEPEVFATIDPAVPPTAYGVLGLWYEDGAVYTAASTGNAATHGIWRVDEDGTAERLPGTEQAAFANAVVVAGGVVYFTESIGGAVWRQSGDDPAEPWVEDELLAGNGTFVGPEAPLGANGLAVGPEDDVLYVGNTEAGRVLEIPILEDGSPGELTVRAEAPDLVGVDGLAVDAAGELFGVIINGPALVHIAADGAVTELAGIEEGLDAPSGLAVGPDGRTLYVVNFSIGEAFGFPGTAGPGVVRVTRPVEVDVSDRDAVAYVSPHQEVPRTSSDAWAWSVWRIRDDATRIDYSATIFDLGEDVSAAHLHLAPEGVSGPVVVPLTVVDRTRLAGSFTAEDLVGPLEGATIEQLVAEIEAGRIYVNVHTPTYPAGEIRGLLEFR